MSGLVSYHAGLCAEERIAADYERRGHEILHSRWRCNAGEIDLIARGPDGLVFVEVKASRSHGRASRRLGGRQVQRLFDAAAEYIAGEPGGQDTDMRFDVATFDQTGSIEIIENAFI